MDPYPRARQKQPDFTLPSRRSRQRLHDAGAHLYQDLWETHFTVVQWDQRGAGKSDYGESSAHTMTIDQLNADTIEMARYLRKQFRREKIFLLGHSWGSFLGIHAAKQHPEWFYAYIGVGQLAYLLEQTQAGYDYTLKIAQKQNNTRALEELESIGRPETIDDIEPEFMHRLGKSQELFNIGMLHKANDTTNLIKAVFESPEYTLLDFLENSDAGTGLSEKTLWRPFLKIEATDLGYDFKLPMFFLSGRYDYVTTTSQVEKYYQKITAPYKKGCYVDPCAMFLMSECQGCSAS